MSTRAQRRDRAQARQGLRAADPVADRAAAAAAIYAEYSTAAVAAFERLNDTVAAAWSQWGTEHAAAWAERCRKLGELEGREIDAPDPVAAAAAEELERELEDDAGTSRLIADLRGQAEDEDR